MTAVITAMTVVIMAATVCPQWVQSIVLRVVAAVHSLL
jgi:hypothetical protein